MNASATLDHDVWRHGGLGKSGFYVYGELSMQRGVVTADVAMAAGLSRSQALKRLKQLVEHGLALRVSRSMWLAVSEPDFDEVARRLGVAGAGLRQRLRHDQERALHEAGIREWLEIKSNEDRRG